MPIYEFVCEKCDEAFETLVRGGQQPACPKCGNAKLTKQFSVPAAHVAGGSSLPIAQRPPMGCSRPGCGPGGCAM
jgi:putative FmdB family regulatory protein